MSFAFAGFLLKIGIPNGTKNNGLLRQRKDGSCSIFGIVGLYDPIYNNQ